MPITTAQVFSSSSLIPLIPFFFLFYFIVLPFSLHLFMIWASAYLKGYWSDLLSFVKGEELRKLIGAPVYIECSSKTQKVHIFLQILKTFERLKNILSPHLYILHWMQNVKAVFDAAIKVVLQPPKQKKTKRKGQKACSILWTSFPGGWHDCSHFLVVFAILCRILFPT